MSLVGYTARPSPFSIYRPELLLGMPNLAHNGSVISRFASLSGPAALEHIITYADARRLHKPNSRSVLVSRYKRQLAIGSDCSPLVGTGWTSRRSFTPGFTKRPNSAICFDDDNQHIL